ncbi:MULTISPECIES: peptidoglycan DD-metalloendopeptidase family protein [unclassified Modestobacter]|uniref:peptidoglycan DD-metalloendopeptidase family protein n=1 Tax=unclassified Modestobacter TaxID=2643866 RepID=UPI0022AA2D53|nr:MULTISPECIES: M23 family metallopeptidase [unclassified Modestobacter]MCZ2811363.1 M23 family metallopeptidase [Modestobacter sp. VKM Ac-2979]MCZ2840876.1 M23 family metallopeptidase [Modestobacter sp. VKM Ac-2980]MCZ2848161.1 M23 family metallopeptidase [Modestobacter sp. VKM Ac-2978]
MTQHLRRPATAAVRRVRAGRRRPSRLLAGALTAAVATVLVGAGGGIAHAEPVNPSDEQLTGALTAQDAAAAEVGRIAGQVAAAEAQLEQVQVLAEAAGTAYLAAEEARVLAEAAAARTAQDLQAAADAVAAAQLRIAEFSRDTYKNGGELTSEMALLDVGGPAELVQKAAMLSYVGDHQVDVLGVMEQARVQQAQADAAARAARDEKVAAEAAAEGARVEAERQLANQQAVYTQVTAEKAALDQQLQDAQVQLLTLQGARNAYQVWQQQRAAEEAAARLAEEQARAQALADDQQALQADAAATGSDSATGSGYARPAVGITSSCFGARWGVTHFGVDIGAPIGTPVRAATAGVVQRAGPATGFGLAVYLRGDDGAITVYGHVNRHFVRAGERVAAGDQIAEVGNRGQSTGPHLHFEVHPDGQMHSGQVDPVPWLRARGITIRGCG